MSSDQRSIAISDVPEAESKFTEQIGMDVQASSPEALQKILVGEIERWDKAARQHNMRAD